MLKSARQKPRVEVGETVRRWRLGQTWQVGMAAEGGKAAYLTKLTPSPPLTLRRKKNTEKEHPELDIWRAWRALDSPFMYCIDIDIDIICDPPSGKFSRPLAYALSSCCGTNCTNITCKKSLKLQNMNPRQRIYLCR